MKIAIAADHAGYLWKEEIKAHLKALGHQVVDFGTHSTESVDYTDWIVPAAKAVAHGLCERGVVFGGSGNGEAMAANKVKGIRCAVVWDTVSARLARTHNDANIISMGKRMVSVEYAREIVETWLEHEFEGGRHQRRINKLGRLAGEIGSVRLPKAKKAAKKKRAAKKKSKR